MRLSSLSSACLFETSGLRGRAKNKWRCQSRRAGAQISQTDRLRCVPVRACVRRRSCVFIANRMNVLAAQKCALVLALLLSLSLSYAAAACGPQKARRYLSQQWAGPHLLSRRGIVFDPISISHLGKRRNRNVGLSSSSREDDNDGEAASIFSLPLLDLLGVGSIKSSKLNSREILGRTYAAKKTTFDTLKQSYTEDDLSSASVAWAPYTLWYRGLVVLAAYASLPALVGEWGTKPGTSHATSIVILMIILAQASM
jgi:hypothetical protein